MVFISVFSIIVMSYLRYAMLSDNFCLWFYVELENIRISLKSPTLLSRYKHGYEYRECCAYQREQALFLPAIIGDLKAEKIVSVIDEPESDDVGALQCRLLLANVIFGGAEINKPTAIRLTEQSFNLITRLGWIEEESERLV